MGLMVLFEALKGSFFLVLWKLPAKAKQIIANEGYAGLFGAKLRSEAKTLNCWVFRFSHVKQLLGFYNMFFNVREEQVGLRKSIFTICRPH